MITIELKSDAILTALRALDSGLGDMSQLMNQIGEALVQSTQERIEQGIAPDGTVFAPRSPVTLDAYAMAEPPKTPIGGPLRLTGDMANGIHHDYGDDFAEVGSNAVQAAMMQFGGSRAAFPNLWGDIPARPYLGISEQDETDVLEIIEDWLESLVAQGN